jgi:hypothetical protein
MRPPRRLHRQSLADGSRCTGLTACANPCASQETIIVNSIVYIIGVVVVVIVVLKLLGLY